MTRRTKKYRRSRKRSPSHYRRRRSSTKLRRRRRLSKECSCTRTTKYRSAHALIPVVNDDVISRLWELNTRFRTTRSVATSDRTACWSLVAIWAAFLTGTLIDDIETHGPDIHKKVLDQDNDNTPVLLFHNKDAKHVIFQPIGHPMWFQLDMENLSADILDSVDSLDLGKYERNSVTPGRQWKELARRMYGYWNVMYTLLKSETPRVPDTFYRTVHSYESRITDILPKQAGEFLVVHVPSHVFIIYCPQRFVFQIIDNSFHSKKGVKSVTSVRVKEEMSAASVVFRFSPREFPSPNPQRKRRLTKEDLKSIEEALTYVNIE